MMKKLVFNICLMLFLSLELSAQYTTILDPNFEAKLGILGYDDISGDGKVPTDSIKNVTSLDIRNSNILDLTGIEGFTSLTTLNCSNNPLTTSFDISQNTLLQSLDAQRAQFTQIDISANIALKVLKVQNSALDELNVEANTALETLECQKTDISEINIINNVNLKVVNLNSLGLEVLDISNNLLLEDFKMTGYSAITSFDFSKHTNLKRLWLQNADLLALNVRNGNNKIFIDFRIENNPNLNCVAVDDVDYSTTKWTNVDSASIYANFCEYTTIPDINFEKALESLGFDDITGDGQVPTALINTVTSIDVSNKEISNLAGIKSFTALETLIVDNNELEDLDVSGLSQLSYLSANTNELENLNVKDCEQLKELKANTNNLFDLDFTTNTNLEILELDNNLSESINLAANTNLVTLSLKETPLLGLNLTANKALINLYIDDSHMYFLNIKNGTNQLIQNFSVTGNPDLTCIVVDNVAYSTTKWTDIDATANFSDTYCRYTTISDPNFEAALFDLDYDDIAGDGQVPTALIEYVYSLDLVSLDITNLSGIKDFKSLTSLTITNTPVEDFDFSVLPQLKRIDFRNNSFVTLDISKNTNLIQVIVNKQENLQTLKLNNGKNEQLTIVEILTNTNLGCIVVDNTTDFLNHWEDEITATNTVRDHPCYYTEIPDINFEAVLYNLGYDDIENDGLVPTALIENVTSLDLISVDIGNLSGLEDFKALADLKLIDIPMTSFDFSMVSQLEKIFINDCEFTNINLVENTSLTEIVIDSNEYLETLEINNEENAQLTNVVIQFNSNLGCVVVDNTTDFLTSWGALNVTLEEIVRDIPCGYTAIPDVNFEIALYILGYDDIREDGLVPTALIENITSLSIVYDGISNIKGIEDFVALETLDAQSNNLTSIDVSKLKELKNLDLSSNPIKSIDLSLNTKLVELDLKNTNISFLNIEENEALETLVINETGVLSNIIFGNNTKLTSLFATDNLLTSLNLSNFTALTQVSLSNNNLNFLSVKNGNNKNVTFFKTTGNSNLTCIQVDDAAYSTTNWKDTIWKDIDDTTSFSDTYCRYTRIEDPSFEAALGSLSYDDISGDRQVPTELIENVTSLILQDTDIRDLSGLEGFKALENLEMTANPVREFDFSKLLLLKEVTFNNNGFINLNFADNPSITKINVGYHDNLETINLKNENNANLTEVAFQGNDVLECIAVDNAVDFVSNWPSSTPDTKVYQNYPCEYTLIPDTNFEAALEALGYDDISGDGFILTENIEYVTSLDVSEKMISNLKGIEDFMALEFLICSKNELDSLDVSKNENLISLIAFRNSLASINLKENKKLEELNLTNNNISSVNLEENEKLISLKMNSNSLTSINVKNNIHLEFLQLNNNVNISEIDITSNKALKELALEDCSTSDLDISNNNNLIGLYILNNNLTSLDLSNNKLLQWIHIGGNQLEGYLDLSSFNNLQEVDVSNSNFTAVNLKNGNTTNIYYLDATENPSLTCIQIDDVTYANSEVTGGSFYIDNQTSFNVDCGYNFSIAPKVILEGAFKLDAGNTVMHDNLRNNTTVLIPTTSPYSESEFCDETIFSTTGENAVVDWVEVQLRSITDISEIEATKSALLLRNGTIVDTDGVSPVLFSRIQEDFYVAITHRNHLTVVSASPISFNGTTTNIDFTNTSNVLNGSNALIEVATSVFAFPAGDVSNRGQIQNLGISNTILQLGNSGYSVFDVDMNGQVQNIDINIIRKNLGKGEQIQLPD
ncbi:leucine-rich repeat domain-containing protein [Tenacibaculum agarivorans]|uniref:leucine-rich repeat domain-containing protein n=1 Tax=Tenacibaculum agarivorans TaxID=1908389 RepID=UPI000AD093E2|nr:leucine-rich repeat domain-containing protein [Tenacibaculum agarivorans]